MELKSPARPKALCFDKPVQTHTLRMPAGELVSPVFFQQHHPWTHGQWNRLDHAGPQQAGKPGLLAHSRHARAHEPQGAPRQ